MSQRYYNALGTLIRNPAAYARTGAPMFKTKCGTTTDINKKTFIYRLDLTGDKTYIGKTTNIKRRMGEHFSGCGAKVTQKYETRKWQILCSCHGFFSDVMEQRHTDSAIRNKGYRNVRGGRYTNSHTF
jgi:hypothetical protein